MWDWEKIITAVVWDAVIMICSDQDECWISCCPSWVVHLPNRTHPTSAVAQVHTGSHVVHCDLSHFPRPDEMCWSVELCLHMDRRSGTPFHCPCKVAEVEEEVVRGWRVNYKIASHRVVLLGIVFHAHCILHTCNHPQDHLWSDMWHDSG